MIGRIVEIAGEGNYLHADRGFLVVEKRGETVGRVPLDDIAGLIANTHDLVYSNNLLVAIGERACPLVVCGKNHAAVSVLWPIMTHHRQGARMDAQLAASLPLRKRLWKSLVQSKLGMQAATLGAYGLPQAPLRSLVAKVRSGDAGNLEGVGARRYWPILLGKSFRRDQGGDGINALLNYGYTVLRATVARRLLATGLHPGLPLHHANDLNAMRLVDDLMEPFRPLVDAQVRHLVDLGLYEVDTRTKRELALLMTRSIPTPEGLSPVANAIERLCLSLAQVFEGGRTDLALPLSEAGGVRAMLGEKAAFAAFGNGEAEEIPASGEDE
jgi:CRISPR-associated protein Cas1